MANHADDSFITVGKIGATYGIKGWLHIHSYTEYGASLFEFPSWLLFDAKNQLKHTLTIEESRPHGGDGFVAKIKGYDTPESARALTGLTIKIKRSDLPELDKGEYYWSDLIGLNVYNTQKELLGPVLYLIETGSNDALVIEHEGKEYAIPYLLDSVIKKIDLDNKEIHVDWELI